MTESRLASLLKWNFACEYCKESLNNGILFSCGHVICSKHSQEIEFRKNFEDQWKFIQNKKNLENDNFIECNTCVNGYNIGRSSIEFQEEFKLIKLLFHYLNFYYQEDPICSECSSKTVANSICLDCNLFLCIDHSNTHSKTKNTILSQDNFNNHKIKKDSNENLPIEIEFLKINNNNNDNKRCEDRSFDIDKIVNISHGHNCISIGLFKGNFDNYIKKLMIKQNVPLHLKDQNEFKINQWRLKELELSSHIRQNLNYKKKLIDEKIRWMENIDREFNILQKFIQEKREEITQNLTNLYDKEEFRIENQISNLEKTNKNFNQSKLYWNDLIKTDCLKGSVIQKSLSQKVAENLLLCDKKLEESKQDHLEIYQLNLPFDDWLDQLESLTITTKADYSN